MGRNEYQRIKNEEAMEDAEKALAQLRLLEVSKKRNFIAEGKPIPSFPIVSKFVRKTTWKPKGKHVIIMVIALILAIWIIGYVDLINNK